MSITNFLNRIIQGNALDILKQIPDNNIDCIITSPPYWGLRIYQEADSIWDGNKSCNHQWKELWEVKKDGGKMGGFSNYHRRHDILYSSYFCEKCNSWLGQLGLEPTLELYIKHLLQITKELKRVLKKTGVMFWVHGDSYTKQGSMVLQNYRLIQRMVDEQKWILKNRIIWFKPNHLPEPVKKRLTRSYETIFMLAKSKDYFFDLDIIREPVKTGIEQYKKLPKIKENESEIFGSPRGRIYRNKTANDSFCPSGRRLPPEPQEQGAFNLMGKNPGDVWAISTQRFPEAHFATFPEKLVEPMIKAGCPSQICRSCGKARVRIIKKNYKATKPGLNTGTAKSGTDEDPNKSLYQRDISKFRQKIEYETIGWTDCKCDKGFEAGIVLDPFAGAGTSCLVAKKLNRNYIGIEISPKYVKIAERRIEEECGRLI